MPEPVREIRICFVGDSLVNGTGDRTHLGWTGRLCQALSQQGHAITYYNLGVRRETSSEIAARWFQEVSCRLPADCDRRVVFSFGINDTTLENGKLRVEQVTSLENTRRILNAAKLRYPVLLVGPAVTADPDHNQRIVTLSSQMALLCEELRVAYLDVFTPLQHSQTWIDGISAKGDGYHPDAEGYAEFAQLVQGWSAWLNWFKPLA